MRAWILALALIFFGTLCGCDKPASPSTIESSANLSGLSAVNRAAANTQTTTTIDPSTVVVAASNIPHFGGTLVNGVSLQSNGNIWGYFLDTNAATGFHVPQMYVTDFPFGPNNFWGAPVLFNLTTNTGNNRAIAINMKDTSTTGDLDVTGLEIEINSPPDRGGDSSGIYIHQSGGGNAMSVYHVANGSYPNNNTGFAIEVAADGGNQSVWSSAENGAAFLATITGSNGMGLSVFPSSDDNLSRRAMRVTDSSNSQENFTVDLAGNLMSAGTVQFTKYKGTGNSFLCFDPNGNLFRSTTACR